MKLTNLFRFRIKTLLILFVFLAIVCTFLKTRLDQFRAQQQAVEFLQSQNLSVEFIIKPTQSWIDLPLVTCFGKEQICKVETIKLQVKRRNQGLTIDHLRQLKHFPWLKDLMAWDDLIDERQLSIGEEKEIAEILFGMNDLEDVFSQSGLMSMATFDQLKQRGTRILHGGLTDFTLEKNFLDCYPSSYLHVNLEKSSIELKLRADSDQVWAILEAEFEQGVYGPDESDGIFSFYVPLPNEKEPSKHYCPPVKDMEDIYDMDCAFYNGVHSSGYDFKNKLLNVSSTSVHVAMKFRLVVIEGDINRRMVEEQRTFDGDLPVASILVEFPEGSKPELIEARKVIAQRGFGKLLDELILDEAFESDLNSIRLVPRSKDPLTKKRCQGRS